MAQPLKNNFVAATRNIKRILHFLVFAPWQNIKADILPLAKTLKPPLNVFNVRGGTKIKIKCILKVRNWQNKCLLEGNRTNNEYSCNILSIFSDFFCVSFIRSGSRIRPPPPPLLNGSWLYGFIFANYPSFHYLKCLKQD